MRTSKSAFTMIELVFVIVVLGILSAVAIPKLSGYINDADDAVAKGTVTSIRAAIANERQSGLVKGINSFPPILDDATTGAGQNLFDGNRLANGDLNISILQYPVKSGTSAGYWEKGAGTSSITYTYHRTNSQTVLFTYYPTKTTDASGKVHQAGTFDCDHSLVACRELLD